jgi:RimJ/RimL family protein N-acetyltransferase
VTTPDPLLIDLPEQIETERLLLRSPRAGDGPMVHEAVMESLETLQPWMPWANPAPLVEQTETWCRKSHAELIARREWHLLAFRKDTGGYIGTVGMHNLDWAVPRFELGYWLRRAAERQGFMGEMVDAMTRLLLSSLSAQRVEIRMDPNNARSRKVAERLGFEFEGVLRNDSRTPTGEVRSSCVYSKISAD